MKKLLILLIIIFIHGCGYTSILKNQNQQDIKFNVTNTEGDFQTNNYIKNQLKLSSNPNSSGVVTDYRIDISLNFTILSDNNKKINYKDSINIKNNSENFEQTEYEKEIKRNFATATKDNLILYLLSLNDN